MSSRITRSSKRTDTGSYQPRKLRAAALPPHLYQDEASPRLHYLPLTCACFRLPCQSAKHGRVLMDRRNHDEDGCGPPGAVGVCAENGQFLSASFLISGALMCVERVSRGFDLGGTQKQTSGFGCSLVSVLCVVTSSNSPSHRRLLSIWCVAFRQPHHHRPTLPAHKPDQPAPIYQLPSALAACLAVQAA